MPKHDHPSDGEYRQPKTRKGAPPAGAPGRPPRTNLQITYHSTAEIADMEQVSALLQAWIRRAVTESRSERKETS